MGARVAIGGIIATADLAALQTDAQMQPQAAVCQAVLTALDGLGQLADANLIEVGARRHLSNLA
jgi:hypothetical protein